MVGTQSFAFKQSISWSDSFNQLVGGNPYLAGEIADSRDRLLEEWMRKHVVTTKNAAGDIEVATGQAVRSENFVPGGAGWEIDGAGDVSFGSGSFRGDITGATGTFGGAIAASAINIGGTDVTSWHVDSAGNMWWGSGGSYPASAGLRISSAGALDLNTGTFAGAVTASSIDIGGTDVTSWHVDSAGNMWWGSAGSYAAAGIRISNTGSVLFTTGTFGGALEGGTIDIGGADATSFHVDSAGNLWSGASTYANAAFRVSSGGALRVRNATSLQTVTLDVDSLFGVGASNLFGVGITSTNVNEVEPGFFGVVDGITALYVFPPSRTAAPENECMFYMSNASSAVNRLITLRTGVSGPSINLIGTEVALSGNGAGSVVVDDAVYMEDCQMRVSSTSPGRGSWVSADSDVNLFLYCAGMNLTSKITPGVLFGSTDPEFTTQNPKPLAGIFGIASETYSANSSGGMFLEFIINDNAPGTSDVVNTSSHGYLMQTSGFKPRNDNVADCGGAANRWDDVYATNGTILTSDLREKKPASAGYRLGLDFIRALDPIAFRWRGKAGRVHQGLGAQTVVKALEGLGHDPAHHALWVAGLTEEGTVDPESRQGLRYTELIGPLIASVKELSEKVERLEMRSA